MNQAELPQMPPMPPQPPLRKLRITISFDTESFYDDDGVRMVVSEPRVLRLFPFENLTIEKIEERGE